MNINKMTLSTALILFPSVCLAQSAKYTPDLIQGGNRWTITDFDDSSVTHRQMATQGLCFYYAGIRGTHQQYYWVSDTYPNWDGRAVQEGDQVFMYGDYANETGHDGMEWQLTTTSKKDEGFGHWHEWRENKKYGRTVMFANAKLQRVGSCARISYLQAQEEYSKLELKTDELGDYVTSPSGLTNRMLEEIQEENRVLEEIQLNKIKQ